MVSCIKAKLCAGLTVLFVFTIIVGIISLFLVSGVAIIERFPYCDALYFGTEEPNTVILPDLRNLSLSERTSLLEGRYELSTEYNLKVEKDTLEIFSLCILKKYFSKVSACLAIGNNVENVVICGPDMRPDCLPSSIVEHYFGFSLWVQEESTVLYAILNIDTSARAGRNLTNTATTLSALWYDVLGCQPFLNLTIAIIFFGFFGFICCFGCAGCCLWTVCLYRKLKQ